MNKNDSSKEAVEEQALTPELGQWFEIKAIAYKTNCAAESETGYPLKTRWQASILETPVRAMFIGKRTVQEGVTDTWLQRDYEYGYDEDFGFRAEKYLPVYLFVSNTRENPFYVFPSDISEVK